MRTLFEKMPIKGWRLLAFLLMLFSVLLSFNEYEVVKEISFFGKSFGTEKEVVSIAPGFISTLFSCALFAVFMQLFIAYFVSMMIYNVSKLYAIFALVH